MRIALLGAARSPNTQSWVAGLEAAGNEIHVLTFHPAELSEGTVHDVRCSPAAGKAGYLLSVPQVRRKLRELVPDVVIGYYLSSYGLIASLSWDGPLALVAAGSDIMKPRSKTLIRYLGARADLFVAWADHMKAQLINLRVPEDKIVVLPRGIDLKTFAPDGQQSRKFSQFQIVSTRNLRSIYRLDCAIRAVRLLTDRGLEVTYVILGGGPLEPRLRRLVADLELESRVVFAGHQLPQRVAAELRTADVYVSMSLSDGASASLFEAMAAGVFPIVSDIPANRDWITHGHNGMLVDPEDTASFACGIADALLSTEQRESAIRLNRNLVEDRLDRCANMPRMTNYLREMVARRINATYP